MSEKKIMLGNEAFARGAWEAGVKVSAAYPGTPSTEISENLAKYDEVYAEWSPNEKVATEVAAGASINIIGEQQGTDGNLWYQIQYTGSGGSVNTGYVSSLYVRLPVSYSTDADFEAYLTSQGFP